jgi:prepilin-type processing-associated H-X9-DG protein
MATTSLVVAVVGLVLSPLPLVALILGLIARGQISRSGGKLAGSGMAIAAICISLVAIPLHAALLYPVIARRIEQNHRLQCLANVKNLALAINMYACDYDGFPTPADRWNESLDEFVGNADTFTCSKSPQSRSAFAFVSVLSTGGFEAVSDPSRQLSIFESDAGWNAAGGKELLPRTPRHLGGDNYGFVDGHARWFTRSDVDQLWWTSSEE